MKVGRLKISIDTHPRLVLGALLVVAALCHFISMPKFICQGDNLAIKAEAAHLVNTGEIGFDPDEKAALASLGKEDGQYFFPNESRHKLFSKYGFFYTISYLPPIWLKKQVTGSVDLLDASKSMTFAFNCYNIVWALVYLSYLYCLYLYFCRNRWLAVALVFLSVYPGYAWYYLRTPDKEVLQMASFTAAIYHMLRYLGSSRNGAVSPWHLVAAFLWGGYTYLLKPLYVLLVVGMAAATVADAFCRRRQGKAASVGDIFTHAKALAIMGGMVLLITVVSLAHNFLRSGVVFDSGYRQDKTVPIEFIFSIGHFFRGLAGYFVLPGIGNWFLHQPLLGLAVFGYPAFFKKHRAVSGFLLAVFCMILTALCFHVEWVGEWCYGPRFCLHLIMMASLPAVEALPRLLVWPTGMIRRTGKTLAFILFACVMLISLRLQFYINTWHYFTFYYYSTGMGKLNLETSSRYFEHLPQRALLNRDLALYRRDHRKFALLEAIDQEPLPENTVAAVYALTEQVIEKYRWNYLLIPPPP